MRERGVELKDFYESKIWEFHSITSLYERIRVQNLLEFLVPESTDIILDAGCGGGTYTKILSRTSTVISVDLSKEATRNAKENLRQSKNVFFIVSDVERLPIRGKSLDKIMCVDVIEHIANVEESLREMARVLKPFGKISIFTACGDNKFSLEYILKPTLGRLINLIRLKMGHIQIFSTPSLRKLLESNFIIINIQYMHHWVGWFLKFLWDLFHLNSSESYYSSYSFNESILSIFSRALWSILDVEYKLLKKKSSGSEIIINAIKKKQISTRDNIELESQNSEHFRMNYREI